MLNLKGLLKHFEAWLKDLLILFHTFLITTLLNSPFYHNHTIYKFHLNTFSLIIKQIPCSRHHSRVEALKFHHQERI